MEVEQNMQLDFHGMKTLKILYSFQTQHHLQSRCICMTVNKHLNILQPVPEERLYKGELASY